MVEVVESINTTPVDPLLRDYRVTRRRLADLSTVVIYVLELYEGGKVQWTHYYNFPLAASDAGDDWCGQ